MNVYSSKKAIPILFVIFFGALFLRVIYLWQYSKSPLFAIPIGPDVSEYYEWAMDILAGEFWWRELKLHSPSYPFFFAFLFKVFSGDFFLIRFVQEFFFLSCGLLTFYFLFVRGDEPCEIRKGLLASFIFAFYPPLIYISGEFVSESLLLPFLCGVLIFSHLALSRKGNIFLFCSLSAFFSALCVLTHPLSLIFVLVNFAYLLYHLGKIDAKIAKIASVFSILVFIVIIAPFSIYNGINFGKFFPLQANSGFNFFIGNNFEADGTCRVRPGPEWDRIHEEAKFAVDGTDISEDNYFMMKSFNFIIRNPLEWVGLLLKKTFLVWNARELISGADLPEFRYFTPIQKWTSWSFALIGTFSLCGLICSFSRGKQTSAEKIMIILLFSFWFAQIATVTSSRYRTAMMPAVIFFAAFFILELKILLTKEYIIKTTCVFFASLLAVCVFPSPFDEKKVKSETSSILAEVYLKVGNADEAHKHLILASSLEPEWSRNYNMLGTIYMEKGLLDKAEECFLRAANCSDSDKSSLMNLAILYDKKGSKDVAGFFWDKAMRGTKTPDLLYNYGVKLQNESRIEEASKFYSKALTLRPSHAGALNNLGVISLLQGDATLSLKLLEKSYKFNHKKFETGINLATAKLACGDRKGAKKIILEIAKFAKKDSEVEKLKSLENLIGKPIDSVN